MTLLADQLIEFIGSELVEPDVEIHPQTELLLSGLVDSLGVVQIVVFLEEQLEREIDPADVILEHFESVAAMVSFASSSMAA